MAYVSGRNLVPNPPASMIPFTFYYRLKLQNVFPEYTKKQGISFDMPLVKFSFTTEELENLFTLASLFYEKCVNSK